MKYNRFNDWLKTHLHRGVAGHFYREEEEEDSEALTIELVISECHCLCLIHNSFGGQVSW